MANEFRGFEVGAGMLQEAQVDGFIQLPENVTKAMAALDTARAKSREITAEFENTASSWDRITASQERVADSLRAGKGKWPDGKEMLERERHREGLQREMSVLEGVVTALVGNLQAILADSADQVIVKTLRPVHDKVVADVRKAAHIFQGEPVSQASALKSDDTRKAFLEFGQMNADYIRIWRLYRFIYDNAGRPVEDEGRFSSLRDGDIWRTLQGSIPEDAIEKLVFIVTQAKPWMPLPSERERRWQELRAASSDPRIKRDAELQLAG